MRVSPALFHKRTVISPLNDLTVGDNQVLDEATANVDPENEDKLIAAFNALTKNKTVIMIAHRLKTIRNADRIVVLDGGTISSGTHEELLGSSEKYSRFIKLREEAASWKMQSA